jgi:hypothetical protein
MGVLDDAIREHLELKRRHGVAEDEVQRQEEEALGPARREVAQQHGDEAESAMADAAEETAAAADAAPAEDTALFDGQDAPGAEEAPLTAQDEAMILQEAVAEEATSLEPVSEDPVAEEPPPVESPPVEPPPLESPLEDSAPTREPDVPALSEEPPVAGQPPVGQEPDIGSHAPDEPEDLDARDARLGDTQPHGFDALEDEEKIDEPEDEDEVGAREEEDPILHDPEADDPDVLEDTPDFLQETPEHDRLWFEQKPPRDFDFD